MIRDDELRDILKDAASAIAERDPNPSTWLNWMVFLLQQLQSKSMAADPMYQDLYRDMLSYLQAAIRNRLKTGGWL